MKIINDTYTLLPSWKRKHKIIFKAVFQSNKVLNDELNQEVALWMWKMGIFD